MSRLNGTQVDPDFDRLRWLWLGGSIVSDRGNEVVTTNRLVIQALMERGQEVEYLEPADHPAFVERLKEDGSGSYRQFLSEYSDIRYRRYDMPRSAEREVWLSREAALVDVLVIESGAPPEIFSWLERIGETALVRLLLSSTSEADTAHFDLLLAPTGADVSYPTVNSSSEAVALASNLLLAVRAERLRIGARGR